MLVSPITSIRGSVEEHVDDYHFPVHEEGAVTTSGIEIPGVRTIVRGDTNTVLGTVKSMYKILTHEEALDPILDRLQKNASIFKRVMLTANGSKMFASIYLKDKEMDISKKDKIWPGITITNSLDGSLKYGCELSIFRLVCTNGLRIPTALASFKMIHTTRANYADVVSDIMDSISDGSQLQNMQHWADTTVDNNKVDQIIEEIISDSKFPAKYKPCIMDEVRNERGYNGHLTAWNVYNAFNSVLEHEFIRKSGKLERARLLDRSLYNAFVEATIE